MALIVNYSLSSHTLYKICKQAKKSTFLHKILLNSCWTASSSERHSWGAWWWPFVHEYTIRLFQFNPRCRDQMIVFNFNHCSLFTPFSCASSSSCEHVTRFNFHSWWWKVDWNYAILCSATNRCIKMGTGRNVFSIFLPRNVQSFSSFEMKLFVRPFPSFNYIIIQFSAKFKTQRVSSVCSSSIMFSPIYLSSLSYVEFFFFFAGYFVFAKKKASLVYKAKAKIDFLCLQKSF